MHLETAVLCQGRPLCQPSYPFDFAPRRPLPVIILWPFSVAWLATNLMRCDAPYPVSWASAN